METKTLTSIATDVLSNYGLGDFDVSVGQTSINDGYLLRIGKTLSLGLEDVKDPDNFVKFVDVMLNSMISKSPFVGSLIKSHEQDIEAKDRRIADLEWHVEDLSKYKNYYELAKGLK